MMKHGVICDRCRTYMFVFGATDEECREKLAAKINAEGWRATVVELDVLMMSENEQNSVGLRAALGDDAAMAVLHDGIANQATFMLKPPETKPDLCAACRKLEAS
jgi:L-alanine-DL-glutamate epimerase-like enolase superfamily enzyme